MSTKKPQTRSNDLHHRRRTPKVSDDHVPPRNLFPLNRTNLVTVPACHKHNGKRSGLDEDFRNYIATHIGDDTPNAQELLRKTVRGLRRNKKIQHWRPDLGAFEVEIKSNSFKPMIEWITRGLYWRAYSGNRLPLDIEMKIGQLRIGEWLPPFVSDMNRVGIGGDQFLSAYNRMDHHPTVSIWVCVFHRRVVAMAMIDVVLQDKLISPGDN
jgi:hypothetical protein